MIHISEVLEKLKTAVYVIEYNAEHEARGLYPYHHQTLERRMTRSNNFDWDIVFKGSHEETITELVRISGEYEKRQERKHWAKTKQREKDKLTPTIRYEIMRRDSFRCVICGRGAEDNVKLHIDHILPLAKGGKTEIDNLRTLCAECNHGKGARIE